MKKIFFTAGTLFAFLVITPKVWGASFPYTIDYRNSAISISEERKQAIIKKVLKSWPESKIESQWDNVYNQAVSHGWNPAFVIALWIEESAASGLNARDLGCGRIYNNLEKQLECLFSRPYANKSFEEFMCIYSEGHYPCEFITNPNFVENLGDWYHEATGAPTTGSSISNVDLDLKIRGYEPISGRKEFLDFNHETDPNAPQLTSLLENTPSPTIVSLYQVYNWDWETNSRSNLWTRPADLPPDLDFATLVGFATTPNQNVLVPDSGYDIGEGYEAMVIYASADSVTLKYTREDSISTGYTIYLSGFQVNADLLNLYNKLNQEGRISLPMVSAGYLLGKATGEPILVAITDTGSFMDPRWKQDWWHGNAATANESVPIGTINALQPEEAVYGECGSQVGWEQIKQQAGRAFGEPFKVSVKVNPFSSKPGATETLLLAIKSSQPKIEFPQNEIIAQVLSATDKKLTPPGQALNLEGKTAQGKIAYIVCEEGTNTYFVFDEPSSPNRSQDLQAPAWLESTKNASGVLQKLLTKTKSQSSPPAQARASSPAVLGEGTSPEETQFFVSIENTRIGDDGRLHYGIRITHTAPGTIGDVLINPEIGIHYENIPAGPGGAYIDTDYAGADQFLPTYPAGTNPDDIFVNIEVRDQPGYMGPKNPLPRKGVRPPEITPTPPPCTMKNLTNGNWDKETTEVCVEGNCHVEKGLHAYEKVIKEIVNEVGDIVKKFFAWFIGMEEIFYIVTPITYTPYTMEIEQNTRETSFKTFHLPNSQYPERENASSPVKYSLEGSIKDKGSLSDDEINILTESNKTDVHTQKGTRDAYEYVIKALTPPTPMPTP